MVKINHSSFSKATRASTLHTLALGCAFFVVSEARADGYEECNQILAQDIFNRVINSDSSSSASNAAASATFFELTDTEAFKAYEKAFDKAKERGTKIDAEFHYGIIGGELGIALNSKDRLTESQFSEKFNKEKQTRKETKSSQTSSSQNLVSNYASYVRDPGTVNAWKDCVTRTRETKPDLYAFASRDRAGKTYVNVMWVPGVLAGSVPSIPISFVTGGEEEDIKIQANPEEQVAMGSGRHFKVSCGTKCDDGFQVIVNGTLKDTAGSARNSFTTIVEVPPLTPPAPPPIQETDEALQQEINALFDRCGERKVGQVGDCRVVVAVIEKYEEIHALTRGCDVDSDEVCRQRWRALVQEMWALIRESRVARKEVGDN